MDLFDYMRENTIKQESPLASRLRPQTLDEVVGQQHIEAPSNYIRRDGGAAAYYRKGQAALPRHSGR